MKAGVPFPRLGSNVPTECPEMGEGERRHVKPSVLPQDCRYFRKPVTAGAVCQNILAHISQMSLEWKRSWHCTRFPPPPESGQFCKHRKGQEIPWFKAIETPCYPSQRPLTLSRPKQAEEDPVHSASPSLPCAKLLCQPAPRHQAVPLSFNLLSHLLVLPFHLFCLPPPFPSIGIHVSRRRGSNKQPF